MAITITRATQTLLGTGVGTTQGTGTGSGSGASISTGTTMPLSGPFLMTGTGVIEGSLLVFILIGGTAITSMTINFMVSMDGTQYVQDGPGTSVAVVTAGAFSGYRYDPPDACQAVQVQFVTTLGSGTATGFVQGSTLAVS